MQEDLVELGIPQLRIAKLYGLREKISQILLRFLAQNMSNVEVAEITNDLSGIIRRRNNSSRNHGTALDLLLPNSYVALAETVGGLILGRVLTKDLLTYVSIRIAANYEKILAGIPVTTCVFPLLAEEWVAVNVKDVELTKLGRANKTAGLFTLQIISGSPAGETITGVFWASMFGSMLRRLRMRTTDSSVLVFRYLVHSKFMVLLTTDDPPRIKMYHDTPTLNRLNSLVHKARTKERACPHDHLFSCTDCYIGYDHCPLATHPNTYILKACSACRREGWFDPKLRLQITCLDCQVKQRMMGHH